MADEKRKRRIEELIWHELGKILISHPKRSLFTKITITAVSVAPDLAVAKVFFSVFDEINVKEATKALHDESKFFRKTVARTLNLRVTPRFIFIYDESIKRSRKLSDLIDAAIFDDENKRC
jgi:ribosome-binding factor A